MEWYYDNNFDDGISIWPDFVLPPTFQEDDHQENDEEGCMALADSTVPVEAAARDDDNNINNNNNSNCNSKKIEMGMGKEERSSSRVVVERKRRGRQRRRDCEAHNLNERARRDNDH